MPSKTLSVIVSEETHRRLEKLAKLKLWSVSQTARVLIEQGLDHEGIETDNIANGNNDKPTQAPSDPASVRTPEVKPPPRDRSKPRVMSLAELFALKTLSSLVQENYYKLQESGKIRHQRLKELASGERASQQERQIIGQVLGIGIEELPED